MTKERARPGIGVVGGEVKDHIAQPGKGAPERAQSGGFEDMLC